MTVQGNDIAIRGPAMRAQGLWRDETLLDHLARAVAQTPDKTAIIACRSDLGSETRLTYGQIDALSSRLAAARRVYGHAALGAVMWFPSNCRIGGSFPSCIWRA